MNIKNSTFLTYLRVKKIPIKKVKKLINYRVIIINLFTIGEYYI